MARSRRRTLGEPTPGTLYVVATPIGNLEDLSPRAARILTEVDVIAAEDTRVSRRVLAQAGAKAAKMLSYRDQNERRMAPRLVESLEQGLSVALVSDAGTPAISDPGYRLVAAAQQAGIEVVTVPGPSAVIALLSVSGLPIDRFSFEGFLPKSGRLRRDAIAAMAGSDRTHVVYESPLRVARLLREIAELLADPEVAVGRELTKKHEELLRGRASQVAELLEERGARGEFAVAIHVPACSSAKWSPEKIVAEVARLLDEGLSVRDAAARLKEHGIARRAVYDAARTIDERSLP